MSPAVASVEGRQIPLTVARAYRGPLIALNPLVRVLGGRLESGLGAARVLEIEGVRFTFGPDSATLIRDEELIRLSQPPISGADGPMVPVDFLDSTYGELQGYRFVWDRTSETLRVERPVLGEISLAADVVHLQGVSTVVLRLPERPRYQIETRPEGVDVELRGVTVSSSDRGRRTLDDPLVRSIDVGTSRVRIQLAAGAEASSYTLEGPFRLVFDVHRRRTASRPDSADSGPEPLRPASPREGIQTIVVDPGHGGAEVGAVGPSGAEEKDLALTLARALKSRLESRLPVKVVLTRNEDAQLPLETRTAIANQNKADLFLSIHLNAAAGVSARGAETYFLSLQASDARAAEAAAAENQMAVGGGDGGEDPLYDLQLILWDLAQSHHLTESQAVARLIQEELNGALGLRDRGVKQAPFRVLMGAAMPAVLVELGFLSNPEEEERLLDPSYRSDLVSALVRAITRYRSQVANRGATSTAEAASEEESPGTGGGLP